MGKLRPFRFGVTEHRAPNAKAWREQARRVESLGYSTLYITDHFGDQLSPVAALMSAADATSTLRVGSLVFDNDYRHPVVLAKEAATLDLLSDGRLDFGLGAGWLATDYEQTGIPFDPPGTRIERMAEALQIIKAFFAGGSVSFTGKHYKIAGVEAMPSAVQKPHPPIILGGGGRRMLRLAAREADIVSINYKLSEGRINRKLISTGQADATDEKLGWIKEAAADRLSEIELSVSIFVANVTDDRDALAAAMASGSGSEPSAVLETPHFLIGTVEQMIEDLQARRERYGISYVIVPGEVAQSLAPIVTRLTGT
ncbi:MAG TPA: TIGR03621 family F420-dependent LLM class oxidoreductase [Candidatus Dormibacteraeota bacterium]